MAKYPYKLNPDEFGAHQRTINWVEPGKKVLEVGCAQGFMSEQLVKKNCSVTGIEINKEAAKEAKKYCQKVIVGDVEDSETAAQLGKEKFEVIIFGGVLEHLKDPETSLKRLVKYLDKKGKVIISVPNVAFLTTRLQILLGRFEYADWGNLDKTHLRFFTQDLILEMVNNCGLKVEKMDYTSNFTQLPLHMKILYPLVGERRWWRKLEYKITGLWPRGLALQFLLFCRKK